MNVLKMKLEIYCDEGVTAFFEVYLDPSYSKSVYRAPVDLITTATQIWAVSEHFLRNPQLEPELDIDGLFWYFLLLTS